MFSIPFYYALLLLCWAYSFLRGGAPERIGTTILLIGSLLTLATISAQGANYRSVELGVFLVDLATLVAFAALALRAERFWPAWIAALQLLGTSGHVIKFVDPGLLPRAYAVAAIFWSYPMLLLLVLGTYRHRRRLQRFGSDPSWSSFSGRSEPPAAPMR
jgi:hypothetical protein